jgi:hypothetical protein
MTFDAVDVSLKRDVTKELHRASRLALLSRDSGANSIPASQDRLTGINRW